MSSRGGVAQQEVFALRKLARHWSAKIQTTKLYLSILNLFLTKIRRSKSAINLPPHPHSPPLTPEVLRGGSECQLLPTKEIVYKCKGPLAKNLETWFLPQFCPGWSMSLSLTASQVPHLKNEEVKLYNLHRPFQPENPKTFWAAFCSPCYKTSDYLLETVDHIFSSGLPHMNVQVVHWTNPEGTIHIIVCVNYHPVLSGPLPEHPYRAALIMLFINFVNI